MYKWFQDRVHPTGAAGMTNYVQMLGPMLIHGNYWSERDTMHRVMTVENLFSCPSAENCYIYSEKWIIFI